MPANWSWPPPAQQITAGLKEIATRRASGSWLTTGSLIDGISGKLSALRVKWRPIC